jgi:hypothetical protein
MIIEYDLGPIQDRLTKMLEKIERTKSDYMPQEFLNWQAEDLNRGQPRLDQKTPISVMTYIRERAASYQLRRVAGKKRRIRMRARPILRPILFEKLCHRMSRMLENYVSWHP